MVCEVVVGRRHTIRCGEAAKLYRIEWQGQSLGEYELCPDHCTLGMRQASHGDSA